MIAAMSFSKNPDVVGIISKPGGETGVAVDLEANPFGREIGAYDYRTLDGSHENWKVAANGKSKDMHLRQNDGVYPIILHENSYQNFLEEQSDEALEKLKRSIVFLKDIEASVEIPGQGNTPSTLRIHIIATAGKTIDEVYAQLLKDNKLRHHKLDQSNYEPFHWSTQRKVRRQVDEVLEGKKRHFEEDRLSGLYSWRRRIIIYFLNLAISQYDLKGKESGRKIVEEIQKANAATLTR
ncbi:MAG: hypothetical protein AAF570_20685 [Bacteroidota bacterium]